MIKLFRAISYNSDTRMVYLVCISLFVIFIIMVLLLLKLRAAAKQKTVYSDKLSPGGFDILAIKKMEKMGQLDDDELKKIKQRMADQYLGTDAAEQSLGNKLPLELELEQAELEAKRIQQQREKKQPPEEPQTARVDPLEYDAPKEKQPQPAMSDDQLQMIRKHIDLQNISIEEAQNFHKMGVITDDELAKIQLPKEPVGTVSSEDLDPSKLSQQELDELYHIGVLTKIEYEKLKQKISDDRMQYGSQD